MEYYSVLIMELGLDMIQIQLFIQIIPKKIIVILILVIIVVIKIVLVKANLFLLEI